MIDNRRNFGPIAGLTKVVNLAVAIPPTALTGLPSAPRVEESATVAYDEDATLLVRVGQGDEQALATLIDKWKDPLLNFFYRSLSQRATSEDLTQMVFIRLYRAAPRYVPRARFRTFLFHIARRLLINELRRLRHHPIDLADPAELHAVDTGLSERRLMEIEEALAEALGHLPEKQRTALLLWKQQDLSYAEIAGVMEVRESAVKTWIFRARQTLKERLQDVI